MSGKGLGKYKTINSFVNAKLKDFSDKPHTLRSLFESMFTEHENIMYEYSTGYRIVKKTYGQVYDEILRRCGTLSSLLSGIPKGSTVGLYLDNSLDWIELFWAIILCGYNPLLMNLRLGRNTLKKALADTESAAVISNGEDFGLKSITPQQITAGEAIGLSDCGSEIYVMSSGTSDCLKICAYTADELYWQIMGSIDIMQRCPEIKKHYNNSLKLLTFLPFYHVFGLIAVYIWFSFFSRTFVQLNDLMPNTITNTVKRHKVTHIFAVPLFWETVYGKAMKVINSRDEKTRLKFAKGMKIANKLNRVPTLGRLFSRLAFKEVREGIFGESIRFTITGGGGISKEALVFFNSIGYRLANGYGMTEIGITSVELSDKAKYLLEGYVGKPISSTEYRINENGELLIRGKACAKYIISGGQRTENKDWYNSHDLAEEKDGHYKLQGRADDVIVTSGGENLNPYLIEPCLNMNGHNGVCLINASDTDVSPVLLVSVDRYLSGEAFAALRKHITQILSEIKAGSCIKAEYITDPLINGDEFKLNRRRLAADYKSGALHKFGELKESASTDPIELKVREYFAAALGRDAMLIPSDSDFFTSEGGTSLAYFAICSEISEEFGVSLPTDSIQKCRTVSGLTEYIKEAKKNVD